MTAPEPGRYNSTVIYSRAQELCSSFALQISLFSMLFHFLLSFNLRWSYRHMPSRYLNLYSTLSLQLASTHSFHGYGLGGIEDWKWHTGDWRLLRQSKLVSPSLQLRSYHKQLFGAEALTHTEEIIQNLFICTQVQK